LIPEIARLERGNLQLHVARAGAVFR